MFKRTIISLAFALLVPTAAVQAAKPTTTSGKIGASVLQTVHNHSKLLTFPVLIYTLSQLSKPNETFGDAMAESIMAGIAWYAAETIVGTTTSALMQNFGIDPI